jgi:hypothetical protein
VERYWAIMKLFSGDFAMFYNYSFFGGNLQIEEIFENYYYREVFTCLRETDLLTWNI